MWRLVGMVAVRARHLAARLVEPGPGDRGTGWLVEQAAQAPAVPMQFYVLYSMRGHPDPAGVARVEVPGFLSLAATVTQDVLAVVL